MFENQKEKIYQQVTGSIEGAFDTVYQERKDFYKKPGNALPQTTSVDGIIAKYSYLNASISGASGLVPGPFGMLAVVPEIIAVTRNQIAMVYDIGVACGKEDSIDKELLMGIFVSATGSAVIGIFTYRGGQLLVKRASLRVIQKLVTILGGKITQQVLKAAIAKWLPVVGAAGMAAWSKYSTDEIAKKAVEIFSYQIQKSNENIETI